MRQRRKFSAEYKREAVAMLQSPGVNVSQLAAELGIGANVLGRWRRELCEEQDKAFQGNGRPRDEEMAALRRELARVTKERDFLREAAAFFAKAST
jgi:transposase